MIDSRLVDVFEAVPLSPGMFTTKCPGWPVEALLAVSTEAIALVAVGINRRHKKTRVH